MFEIFFAIISALWLGILTSISPCPLATNIAAISFIGRHIKSPAHTLIAGILYAIGRTLTYLVISILFIYSIFSIPGVSNFLQQYMNKILGPVLILVGMVLLELLKLPFISFEIKDETQNKIGSFGIWGALILGVIFALSFCPVSAALFFGSLIPLSLKYNSNILLPLFYGIGTALPVIFFAFLIAVSARSLGKVFNKLSKIDYWSRKIAGVIFILVGIYFSLAYIFNIFS